MLNPFKKWADAFLDLVQPSRNEGRLGSDAYVVKRKLGNAFFTRRLSPGTRRARAESLTRAERRIARQHGWIAK